MNAGTEHHLDARIAGLLADRTPRTIAQLAAELNEPAFAVRWGLKRLHRQGRIVCAGRMLEHRRTFGAPAQHWAALWTMSADA
jgi:predicted ArsR family transcriptional regulator